MVATVEQVDLPDEAMEAFKEFGAYANYRSIPDVRDGMKLGGRRILWAMYEAGAIPGKRTVKAMSAIGDVLKYHPHGDSGTYTAMTTMAHSPSEGAPVKRYMPLIHGQGSWGDLDFPAAAARYTECRLNEQAVALLGHAPGVIDGAPEIRENGVEMMLNFSGDKKEPTVLPSMLPNYVINGAEGIGVGIRTMAASHNVTEALNLAIKMIDSPNMRWETIKSIMPGPDLPADCDIFDDLRYDGGGIKKYMTEGYGAFIMRARYIIEEYTIGRGKKGHTMIVTGLPDGASPSMAIAGISGLIEAAELPQDIEIANYTSAAGIRLEIDLKGNDVEDVVQRLLYHGDKSRLQSSFSVQSNAIVNGQARTVSTIEAMQIWIDHRRDVVRRRTRYRLNKAEERLEIVLGFIKAVPIAEEIVTLVRASDNRQDASNQMIARWGFTERQTQAILDMTIGQITKLGIDRFEQEKINLEAIVADCKDLLGNPASLDGRIKEELRALRKVFGTDRRCHLRLEESGTVDRPTTPAIEIPAVKGLFVLGSNNWLRWAKTRSVSRIIGNSDHVTSIKAITNQNHITAVSSWGYQYGLVADDLPERMTKADALFALDQGEHIIYIEAGATIPGDDTPMILLTRSGQIKKISQDVWTNIKPGKYKPLIGTNRGSDPVDFAFILPEGHDIGIITGYGKLLRLSEGALSAKGRGAGGNDAIKLEGNDADSIVWAGPISDSTQIAYVTSDERVGWFWCSDIPTGRRNGRGATITKSDKLIIRAIALDDANGDSILKWFDGSTDSAQELALSGQTAGYGLTDRQIKMSAPGIKKANAAWLISNGTESD